MSHPYNNGRPAVSLLEIAARQQRLAGMGRELRRRSRRERAAEAVFAVSIFVGGSLIFSVGLGLVLILIGLAS